MKGDNWVSSPKILGQHRKGLKFIATSFAKYLKNKDLCEALLGVDSKIMFSTRNSGDESEVETDKDPVKNIRLMKACQNLRKTILFKIWCTY